MNWRFRVKCVIWDRALTLINNTGRAISCPWYLSSCVRAIHTPSLWSRLFLVGYLVGFSGPWKARVVIVSGQVCGFPWGLQRDPRSVGSEAALDKRVAENPLGSGPPFLFHKDLPQEVPACVRHTLRQVWLSRLGCNLENGCHCFIFSPRGLLG